MENEPLVIFRHLVSGILHLPAFSIFHFPFSNKKSLLKLLAIFHFSFLISHSTIAQHNLPVDNDEWESGLVVLDDGDTVSGSVQLNLENELLLVYSMGTTKTYTARQVASFFLGKQGRAYGTFPYARHGNYAVPRFFEVLSIGPCLSILARETRVLNQAPAYAGYTSIGYFTYPGIRQDYYGLLNTGKVVPLPPKRKDFLKLLNQKEGLLADYIQQEKLKTNHPGDLDKIAQKANQLNICQNQSP